MHATIGQRVKDTVSQPSPTTASLLGAYVAISAVDVLFLVVADPGLQLEANPILLAVGSLPGVAVVRLTAVGIVLALALALDEEWPVAGGLLVGTMLTLVAVVNNIHVLTLIG